MRLSSFLKNKVKGLIYKLQHRYFVDWFFRLPSPSPEEKQLINDFREEMSDIKSTLSGPFWTNFVDSLKKYSNKFDPRNILRWDIIQNTMFMTAADPEYLNQLRSASDWEDWSKVITEDSFGNPAPDPNLPQSSGNLINHVYHLNVLKKNTGIDLGKTGLIVEYGSGYGCMCKLVRKLGYKGVYILFDLPEMSVLQRFYLNGIGVATQYYNEKNLSTGANILLNDLKQLRHIIGAGNFGEKLFIANWSISETPLSSRNDFLEVIKDFDYFQFGYQSKFDQVDNVDYFQKYQDRNPNVQWFSQYMKNWNGYYLLGKKNKNFI